jgi:Lar family restriction alleviation protein
MAFMYLKPCPFCGNDQVDVARDTYCEPIQTCMYVVCPSCGAQGPIACRHTLSVDDLRVEAMRKWERRASE